LTQRCEGLKLERECREKLQHAYRGSQNRWDEAYSGKGREIGRTFPTQGEDWNRDEVQG